MVSREVKPGSIKLANQALRSFWELLVSIDIKEKEVDIENIHNELVSFFFGMVSCLINKQESKENFTFPSDLVSQVFKDLQNIDVNYDELETTDISLIYAALMDQKIEISTGNFAVVWRKGKNAATTSVIDIDKTLRTRTDKRHEYLEKEAKCRVSGVALELLKVAKTPEDVINALKQRIAPYPLIPLPPGSLYLVPTNNRRSTGAHYTPRAMTKPIVRDALEPILKPFGNNPTTEQILGLKICDLAMGAGVFLSEVCCQLSQLIIDAKDSSFVDLKDVYRAIISQCLYGVDRNPLSVDIAKLCFQAFTFSEDKSILNLDHSFRSGDSLVGLNLEQIKAFTWEQNTSQHLGIENQELSLDKTRIFADLIFSAFFSSKSQNARKTKLNQLKKDTFQWFKDGNISNEMEKAITFIRDNKVTPFNWSIEFPEVFNRENPGFDVIVGNPPFAGRNTIINSNNVNYLDWLKEIHLESRGNSDLAAHFFRRGFNLIRQNGILGLIVTNTISQGDTRVTGLRFICNNGGTIYRAIKRKKWEGAAAVVVSVVHLFKGVYEGGKLLDEKEVDFISAFLFHGGSNDNPKTLLADTKKSFEGVHVSGMGFTFDDTSNKATSIAEMERLIAENPKNKECIFPFIGGSEVNSSPSHKHYRYIINFGKMNEAEARRYPDLMKIVEEKVRLERNVKKRKELKVYWWQYAEKRPRMVRAITGKQLGENITAITPEKDKMDGNWWQWHRTCPALSKMITPLSRVLVCPGVSKYLSFAFLPSDIVFSNSLLIFTFETNTAFTVLQSHVHEAWARFLGTSLVDSFNYSLSDCFETFPFPSNWEKSTQLENAGKAYHEYRAQLMIQNNQGLTATYNRFHDPRENDPAIKQLRKLHGKMDAAVLKAYGWEDIPTDYDFYLDYEDASGKKKPYRYRWSDAVVEEILNRLMQLNQIRYAEEQKQKNNRAVNLVIDLGDYG